MRCSSGSSENSHGTRRVEIVVGRTSGSGENLHLGKCRHSPNIRPHAHDARVYVMVASRTAEEAKEYFIVFTKTRIGYRKVYKDTLVTW